LSKANRALNDLYGAFPLNSGAIFNAEDEVTSLEKGVERLTDLETRLF
tara:strand:+ start:3470 stop:3613 length:144 start_codon:yes stop_codon:yes gene_type:complete